MTSFFSRKRRSNTLFVFPLVCPIGYWSISMATKYVHLFNNFNVSRIRETNLVCDLSYLWQNLFFPRKSAKIYSHVNCRNLTYFQGVILPDPRFQEGRGRGREGEGKNGGGSGGEGRREGEEDGMGLKPSQTNNPVLAPERSLIIMESCDFTVLRRPRTYGHVYHLWVNRVCLRYS